MVKSIRKQHYWIGIASLVCILSACNKEPKNIPINTDIKNHFSFKKGTYWIYKDSTTAQTDSFVVVNNTYGTSAGNTGNYDQEVDNILVYQNGNWNDTFIISWSLSSNYVGYFYQYTTLINYQLFIFPFQPGYKSNNANGYVISNVFNTFSLYGQTFNTVAEITQSGENGDTHGVLHEYEDLYYISVDVGIIKMRLNHLTLQSVWELQRYKVLH